MIIKENSSYVQIDYMCLIGAKDYTVTNCTSMNDTVCSRCEPDLIWSDDLARCVRCGPCCSNSTMDSGCSGDSSMGCIYDPDCDVTTFSPNGFGR